MPNYQLLDNDRDEWFEQLRRLKMSNDGWLELGYGDYDETIAKLPAGKLVLILDEDCANAGMPDCWFAKQGDIKTIEIEYEDCGGSVSEAHVVEVTNGR